MKKSIKLILCLTLIAVMSFSFCSCAMLDDAKKSHGIYSEDKNEITIDGVVYKLAPEEIHKIYSSGANIPYQNSYNNKYKSVFVTEKDVPVLVSSFVGDYYEIYKKGKMLYTYDYYYDDISENVIIGSSFGTFASETVEGVINDEEKEELLEDYKYYSYDEDFGEYYFYSYYIKADEYDAIVNELMK